ncbi:cytochrome P450 [Xylaria cf. heliscus]|nr:cytochrome P450 [Xylaria cf. heliscus]
MLDVETDMFALGHLVFHCFLAFLAWRAWVIVYRLWFHPLSYVPGPFLGRISNFYRIILFIIRDEHLLQIQLHEKYGPVLRYSPSKVIVSDVYFLPQIYNMKADKTDFTAPNFNNVSLFNLYSHLDHRAAKRRIAHAYAMKNIRTFQTEIGDLLGLLMKFLAKTSTEEGTASTNALSHMNWFTFDVIGLLYFGKAFGFIEQEQDVRGLIQKFTYTIWLGEFLGELDNLSWLGQRLLQPNPQDEKGIGAVMAERDRIIGDMLGKYRDLKVPLSVNTLLYKFLHAHNEDGSPMTMVDVKAEILLALQAGSENASLNLALAVWNISRHPHVHKKLQKELDDAEEGGILGPRDIIISYDEAVQLPYLGACIRQSLRYSSSITQIGRLTLKGSGLTLGGVYMPPDISVSTSAWIIGRDKALYGDDSWDFRSERWIEASPERFKRMEALDFVFGHGARRCLGRHVALMELWTCVAEVYRRFEFDDTSASIQELAVNWQTKFWPRECRLASRSRIFDNRGPEIV